MSEQRSGRIRRNATKEQGWRDCFAEQVQSGLKVAEFCRKRGITASVFYFWRKEIARRDAERNTVSLTSRPQVVKPMAEFAEVEVAKSKVVHDRDERNAPPITIHFANDCRIEVPVGFHAPALREVLRVLRGESC